MSKQLVKALTDASKALASLPTAPTFDRAAIETPLKSMGLDAASITAAVDFAAKKHAEQHGDGESRAMQEVIRTLASSFSPGLEGISRIAGRMASESRNAGKLTYTASQYNLALNGKPEDGAKEVNRDVLKVIESARELRRKDIAWSTIGERLNLSESSRQAIYMVCKDHKSFTTK